MRRSIWLGALALVPAAQAAPWTHTVDVDCAGTDHSVHLSFDSAADLVKPTKVTVDGKAMPRDNPVMGAPTEKGIRYATFVTTFDVEIPSNLKNGAKFEVDGRLNGKAVHLKCTNTRKLKVLNVRRDEDGDSPAPEATPSGSTPSEAPNWHDPIENNGGTEVHQQGL